jgi:hypothetical protein
MERLNQKAGIFEGAEMLYEIYERMLAWDLKVWFGSLAEEKPCVAQVPEMRIVLIGEEGGEEVPEKLYRISSAKLYPFALLTGAFCDMPYEVKAFPERPYNILLESVKAVPGSKKNPLPSEISYSAYGKATPAEEILSNKKWRCALVSPSQIR